MSVCIYKYWLHFHNTNTNILHLKVTSIGFKQINKYREMNRELYLCHILRIYSCQLGLYILQHCLNIPSLSIMMNVAIDDFKIDGSGDKRLRLR